SASPGRPTVISTTVARSTWGASSAVKANGRSASPLPWRANCRQSTSIGFSGRTCTQSTVTMDFNDSVEEAAFRSEVRAWIALHSGPFDLDRLGPMTLEAELALGRQWLALKAQKGFAKVAWPHADGGMGGTAIQEII